MGEFRRGPRLPKTILETAGLHVGDEISCRLLDSGAILLTPLKGRMQISEGTAKPQGVKQSDVKW